MAVPPSAASAAQVQAWVEAATDALHDVGLGPTAAPPPAGLPPRARARVAAAAADVSDDEDAAGGPQRPLRRRPSQRDSLRRREALLVGKEGSRRRQRWENAHFLGNPHAVPPLPSDWEVHPTYPRHAVPYFLAPLWDPETAARRDAEQRALRAKQRARATAAASADGPAGHVPRDLRHSLKKARAGRGLLMELEEEVRRFVAGWEAHRQAGPSDTDAASSSDDEVVFVGRGGAMRDAPPSPASPRLRRRTLSDPDWEEVEGELRGEKLVYGGLERDRQAAFGRWLVHGLAEYYGLRAWSVTQGDPARREAYVGIRTATAGKPTTAGLPRPLWGIV